MDTSVEFEDGCDYEYDDCSDGDYDEDVEAVVEEEYEFDDGDVVHQQHTVLSESDIRRLEDDCIVEISNTLSLSRAESTVVLVNYKWDVSKIHYDWFADEVRVRGIVGLPTLISETPRKSGKSVACAICFERYRHSLATASACGHRFCNECWGRYIAASIADGPRCLLLRCPEPSCRYAVGSDAIDRLASVEDQARYYRFLVRSYVEQNKRIKWCPAPDCGYAVSFVDAGGKYDVCCKCGYGFCWNCSEEAHRPVDCETVHKWVSKNSSESANTEWILANSKPCPKCKRPIEKNSGCMHMTCSAPCRFEFCWLCLGDWSQHNVSTGGNYSCNNYEAAKKDADFVELENKKKMAKESIHRYTHYYERWAANHKSRQQAVDSLQSAKGEKLEALMGVQKQSNVEFVIDAWEQIVECRRVLKWTYAYGYYIGESEHGKRVFFEYLQGEAEAGLERLHRCAETELEEYLKPESGCNSDRFGEFREKLAGLTRVVRTYFQNLVRALENGLQDVDCVR